MKKILVPYPLPREGLRVLFDRYHVTYSDERITNPQKLKNLVDDHHGLLAVARVNQEVIDQASNLEIISNYGVGYDNIDIDYATRKGIVVTNTPTSTTKPTAELAVGLMLSLVRRIAECDRELRSNPDFRWGMMNNMGRTLFGKTLGIVGLGRIGQAVASMALPFGMKIIYNNRNRLAPGMEKELGVAFRSLPDLLGQSDVVSLHNPMNSETFHLIGKDELELMKPGAFLINTSRGPVVDEEALITLLENKHLGGAGLDVYEKEPRIPAKLLQMPNVVLTPHIGTETHEARVAMAEEAASNLVDYFEGKTLTNQVNKSG